jgi:hypothetical protein
LCNAIVEKDCWWGGATLMWRLRLREEKQSGI